MGGREGKIDMARLLRQRIQLTGSVLRTRDADFKAELLADLERQVWPLFGRGELKPQLERTFRYRMPRKPS